MIDEEGNKLRVWFYISLFLILTALFTIIILDLIYNHY